MAAKEYLAVYGTLRPGFTNPYALLLNEYGQYVGEGTFPGHLFDLGSYPGAVCQSDSLQRVHVSVYDVTQNHAYVLAQLDTYEGAGEGFEPPTEYIRTRIPVLFAGQTLLCWLYVYNWPLADSAPIPSGDYLDYCSRHKKNGL